MKMNKRLILTIAALFLVLTGTVLGTVAFFTDTEQVVNTVTVGKVDISLDEADVKTDGTYVTDETKRVTDGNLYHLIPGKTYIKDPTLTVRANSETSYVRMLVTINNFKELKAMFAAEGLTFLPENCVTGWDAAKWPCVRYTDNGDNTVTCEFRYHTTVKPIGGDAKLEPLFTDFTVPGFMDGAHLSQLSDLEITVVGHAIQAEGFANADAAWAKFEGQQTTNASYDSYLQGASTGNGSSDPAEGASAGNDPAEGAVTNP